MQVDLPSISVISEMSDAFELPVTLNGKELSLPARILTLGWVKRVEVESGEGLVHFERDEEGSWRALSVEHGKGWEPGKEFCAAVIASLSYLFDE